MIESDDYQKLVSDLGRQARFIAGREIFFDWEGFLWDAADWSEEIAEILARESGIEVLMESHWTVLRYFRAYYAYHGRAPLNRHLKEGTGMPLREIEFLFPQGIRLGARRLSGLPNPKSCF